jgi:hypothetical protein
MTMAAVLLAAGGTQAAPFQVQADGSGGAWVVDAGTGTTRLCRTYQVSGPKVLDVFGGGADARAGMDRPARPECELVMGALDEPAAMPATGMLGIGLSGPQVGSAAGMLGYGAWGWSGWAGGPDTQVIIVRPEAVGIGLY